MGQFYNGLALVSKDGYDWFSINKKGEKIADLGQVTEMIWYTDLVISKIDGKKVLLNLKGETICEKNYSYIADVGEPTSDSEIYIVVKDNKSKKYGVINHQGELVIPCTYFQIGNKWNADRFAAKKTVNGKWGIIDDSNNELTPFVFDQLYFINAGKIFTPNQESMVSIGNQRMYVDSEGEKILRLSKFNLTNFIHNYEHNSCYTIPYDLYKNNEAHQIGQYMNTFKIYTKLAPIIEGGPTRKSNLFADPWAPQEIKNKPYRYGLRYDGTTDIAIKCNLQMISGFLAEHTKVEYDNHIFHVNIQGEIVDNIE